MRSTIKKIFNPFEGRNKEEVWQEIRKAAKSIPREEALRRIAEAVKKEKAEKRFRK